ncbi:hypothetical protein GCM10007874_26180 [Labrys miyagiensis]|uniref:DUF3175 domain-containing protein n=1 Tax=Labrys miyagiensis TaxID=346912 RepID=A0ABQ6CGY4_9HYPH|nr:DUF3175 domain-containing protein [Labrys miyagiensis]GLS19601.1 hypothetical protein GCM10007874_26180 [Labrys miyagiensis]
MSSKKAVKPEGEAKRVSRAEPQQRKRGGAANARRSTRKWSGDVTEKSNALDLQKGVFTSDSPEKIAKSLKHSAEVSHRRKADPFRSALSMLTFYINRAGKNLSAGRRRTLMAAKDQLRRLFGH